MPRLTCAHNHMPFSPEILDDLEESFEQVAAGLELRTGISQHRVYLGVIQLGARDISSSRIQLNTTDKIKAISLKGAAMKQVQTPIVTARLCIGWVSLLDWRPAAVRTAAAVRASLSGLATSGC